MKERRIWNKRNMKTGIFQKLMVSYIIFAVLTVISFVVCLVLSAIEISGGNPAELSPYEVIDAEGEIVNLEMVTRLGGWIEVLDTDYRITQVYGRKQTEQQQYTQMEIYELLYPASSVFGEQYNSVNVQFIEKTHTNLEEDHQYIGFLKPVGNEYYFVLYDRAVMQVTATAMLGAVGGEDAPGHFPLFEVFFPILFLLNCVLLSLYLRRRIKKPLDALAEGMERVKAGEQNVNLQFQTESEFERLRDSFNVMASRLEQEQKEKTELIQRKNQMLLELSHDIKTPVATIKSCANALEAGLVPEEKMRSYYQTIDVKADRIRKLSEDMFLMLRMDYADYPLQFERVDICELLRKICAEYYEELEAAGFQFTIEIPEKGCRWQLDVRLFARVIGNLLSNAEKYNRRGNQIRVRLELSEREPESVGRMLNIDVMDDGEPIAPDLEEHIFDAFMRGDQARNTDGGSGLGLAISKAIIEKHQGRVDYRREEEWNCFHIRLEESIEHAG